MKWVGGTCRGMVNHNNEVNDVLMMWRRCFKRMLKGTRNTLKRKLVRKVFWDILMAAYHLIFLAT